MSTASEWIPFACDGRALEYLVVETKSKTRPPDWPAYKASPGKWMPERMLIVRSRGDDGGGFGRVYGPTITITLEDAMSTAREFRAHIR